MKKKVVRFCGLRNLGRKKLGRVLFQVMNLILYTFAFSYFFALVDDQVEVVTAQAQQNSDGTLAIPESESPDFQMNCCRETKKGSICEDILSSKCGDECGGGCIQTSCSNVADCRLGYCFDTKQGTCPANDPRAKCEEDGGRWSDAKEGEPALCKKGCCVLGGNTQFTTELQCKRISAADGLKVDFRPGIVTEIECVGIALSEEKGACVTEIYFEQGCRMGTRQECNSRAGKFYRNVLCTSERLQAGGICKKTERTTCKDDLVYFLDSCGNLANVYDFSRISDPEYWDTLIPAEQSCGFGKGNSNSKSCGNCDYFRGSFCGVAKDIKPSKGDYICRNINCQYEGQEVKNGEAWCVYDGDIGDGVDLVGSRHWRRLCSDGEIKVEPCDDFRNYICVQEDTPLDEGGGSGETFASSKCRVNRWQECASYNSGSTPEEIVEKCTENTDCALRTVDVDEGYQYSLCVPNYPPGFDLSTDDRAKSAEQICGMGSNKCTVVYEKKFTGWECVQNCDCEEKEFTEKMNKLCTSMGDCGLKRNIAGDVDDAYVVKGAPKLAKSEAVGSLTLPRGKHAKPGKYLNPVNDTSYAGHKDLADAANLALLSIVGFGGVVYATAIAAAIYGGATSLSVAAGEGVPIAMEMLGNTIAEGGGVYAAGVTNYLLTTAVAAAVAFLFTKAFGLQGDAALVMTVTGVFVGVVVAAGAYFVEGAAGCLATGPAALVCLLVIVVLLLITAIILKALGIGKIKKTIVEFQCKPWQAPTGGEKCTECNKDPWKPCSKYRCESLGQACQFINEGTKQEVCVAVGINDVAAPFISPNRDILSSGYTYSDISQNGFRLTKEDGGCLDSFTPVLFGIQTNEPAQCRLSLEHTKSFEEMADFFGGSNLYKLNHTMPLFMPSNDAIKASILEGINVSELSPEDQATFAKLDETIRGLTGNLNFYVRCQDYNGNGKDGAEFNIRTCMGEGPDRTAPAITDAKPGSGSYAGSNTTTMNVSILVNEPSECRWGKNNLDYGSMPHQFDCETGLTAGPLGWKCTTNLTDLNFGENQFYFRCKDNPHLLGEEGRNANQQGYSYIVNRVKDKLIIIKASPQEDIISGKLLNTVTLEVETLQGAEQGKARCDWNYNGGAYTPMFETYSTVHKQVLTDRPAGVYPIGITCEDAAEDIAKVNLTFALRIDASPPVVTRAYKSGEELKILTSEIAECRYSFTGCNFKFEDAAQFVDDEKEHTTAWKTDVAYYVVCRDRWGNLPKDCSIRVKGYKVM